MGEINVAITTEPQPKPSLNACVQTWFWMFPTRP